jgi:antitoxin VapB
VVSEVFRRALRIYEKFGSPHEWILCDQGGVVGYSPYEMPLRPDSGFRLREHMALSWNPTIGAARSQDTIIVDDQGFEVVTAVLRWPVTTVSIRGQNVDRPAILIR